MPLACCGTKPLNPFVRRAPLLSPSACSMRRSLFAMKILPVMTPEMADLFAQAVEYRPGFLAIEWESVEIDDLDGKRFLCLQSVWFPGQTSPIYVHFHPEGATDAEMQALTVRHGLEGCMPLEE